MNFIKRYLLKSRWIGTPPLQAGELLRQSSQVKQGLVMGMRLAVLEGQAAFVVAEGQLAAVFLPGAYQLEQDKMPPLKPDAKYSWLYPAQLYFLNLAPAPPEPWQLQEPLLTRDPDRGLMQLALAGEYEAHVQDPALFMQTMVLEHNLRDWPALHNYVNRRINALAILMMSPKRTAVARLAKMKEKTAYDLLGQLNAELREKGLVLLNMNIHTFDIHPLMRRLWQEQNEYLTFNRALSRSIVG